MGQGISRDESQWLGQIVDAEGCLTFSRRTVEVGEAGKVQALGETPSSLIVPPTCLAPPAPPIPKPSIRQGGLSVLLRRGFKTEAPAGNLVRPHMGEANDAEPLTRRQSSASTGSAGSQGGSCCGFAAPDAGLMTPSGVLSVRSTLSGGGSDDEALMRAQHNYTRAVPVAPPTPCSAQREEPVSRRGLKKEWAKQWKQHHAVQQQQEQQEEQPKQPAQPDYNTPYWQHVLHCKDHVHCRNVTAQLLSGSAVGW